MKKNKGGRPPKIDKDILQKLEYAFSIGCTDSEACAYAGIAMRTLYYYCEKNEEFMHKKEVLKNMPVFKAKAIVNTALDNNDLNTANRVIDRKEGQKIKQEISNADGQPFKTERTIVFKAVTKDD